jgi:Polyketide cyclase / dehydrase and lipid transport
MTPPRVPRNRVARRSSARWCRVPPSPALAVRPQARPVAPKITKMPHAHLDASLTIHAPARVVFDRMNDLSRFNDWNPFPAMDPTTVSRHEGPASGPGAVFEYEGKRLGKGRMQIASTEAPRHIAIDMTFWRGATPAHAKSAFVVVEAGDDTEVHWTFDEDRGFGMYLLGKLMFDRMMTNTFRGGLEKLRTLVEAEVRASSARG